MLGEFHGVSLCTGRLESGRSQQSLSDPGADPAMPRLFGCTCRSAGQIGVGIGKRRIGQRQVNAMRAAVHAIRDRLVLRDYLVLVCGHPTALDDGSRQRRRRKASIPNAVTRLAKILERACERLTGCSRRWISARQVVRRRRSCKSPDRGPAGSSATPSCWVLLLSVSVVRHAGPAVSVASRDAAMMSGSTAPDRPADAP